MGKIINLIAPKYCKICIEKTHNPHHICSQCVAHLPWHNQTTCAICAVTLTQPNTTYCGKCATNTFAFDKITAAFNYTHPINNWIKQFKYQHTYYLAHHFAALLAPQCLNRAQHIDVLIPMPISFRRWYGRGFNQAALLAKHISQCVEKPVAYKILKKIKHTKPQAQLTRSARMVNQNGTMQAHSSDYKRAALIDDVVTTGATVHAASQSLKRAGFKHVEVWCIARSSQ